MAQQARQVNFSQLPPAPTIFAGDIFVIDQLGGDGYTKHTTFETLYTAVSTNILTDLYDSKVDIAGDTMTGYLTLVAAPTANLHASTKKYVDDTNVLTLSAVRLGYVPLSGGIMTGRLTLNGNPTSNLHAATKQYVDSAVGGASYAVPVGAVLWFAGSTAPTGFLFCSGGEVPNGVGIAQGKSGDFSALYTVLGTTYGNAGELPDLRGEFVRGWDGSSSNGTAAGVDTNRVFGSNQTHQVGQHSLSARALDTASGFSPRYLASKTALAAGFVKAGSDAIADRFLSDGPKTNIPRVENNNVQLEGQETRPRNIALLPCIKF